MNDRIHAQLTGLMNNTTTRSYLQDAVITMRDGRYCLPVRAEPKPRFPVWYMTSPQAVLPYLLNQWLSSI